MLIGVPCEIKTQEYRVGLTPSSVREIVHHGHDVIVQTEAGLGANFTDDDYRAVGATVAPDAATVFAAAEMIVKVKEPQAEEFVLLREGQILFTYLHLAAARGVAEALISSGVVGIAYETVTSAGGGLPLLAPMSEVAGRMAIQVGAHCLEKEVGGRGVLLGGVPGVEAANVLVIGGGVAGTNAVRMAMGMEARVTVLDRSLDRLRTLDMQFGPTLNTIYSTVDAVERYALDADLVVGAVLVPGAMAPKLVSAEMVKEMRRGAVLVDIAIDQGGCFETSHATTHDDPTFIVDEVVHYCVANMPAAVARSSTTALNNATLPFVLALADQGYRAALQADVHFRAGLNVYAGAVTHDAVATALDLPLQSADEALKN